MNRPLKPTAAPATSADDADPPPPVRARVIDIEDPLIGKQLAHFQLTARVGQGEHGTVYRAQDLTLDQAVAVKLLRRPRDAGDQDSAALLASARTQAKVSHPNVAKLRYIGESDGRAFIVADYVEGQSLRRTLSEEGAMPWEEAVALMVEIVRALDAANSAGVLHGALTSSNVILQQRSDPSPSGPVVKVVDFGVGLPGSGSTGAGPDDPYLAPELASGGPATLRGDLYALGVIFHEMLTGATPQPGRALPEGAAPPYIRRLVAFLMRSEPRQRPSGYDELMGRLEVALIKPSAAKPTLSRAAAFGVDLSCLLLCALASGTALSILGMASRWEGYQAGLLLYAGYWIAAHKVNRQSLGKRLCGLRLQKARGTLSWGRVSARFLVEFWGLIAAVLLIDIELGNNAGWSQITSRVGTAVVIIGASWLASFLVVLTDRKGLALHDHATETSVASV